MGKHKGLLPLRVLCVLLPILLLSDYVQADQVDNQHYMPPLECYDPYGRPQVRSYNSYIPIIHPLPLSVLYQSN